MFSLLLAPQLSVIVASSRPATSLHVHMLFKTTQPDCQVSALCGGAVKELKKWAFIPYKQSEYS